MVGAFRLQCSKAVLASVPRPVRAQVIRDAVASAERLAPNAGETAIYDVHDLRLKVVVRFAERRIWLLTKEEADRAGLPDRPPLHTRN